MGMTFRGIHSMRDMHVGTRIVSRPICPPVRTITEDIPYMDGSLDYSEEGGRLFYDDKVVDVEISVIAGNPAQLNGRISKVVSWLNGGYSDLIFDDMPEVSWTAKPVQMDSVAAELQRVGKSTIQFRCKPFNKAIFLASGIKLDDKVPLSSNIPIGMGTSAHTWSGTEDSYTLTYDGTAPVAPLITVSGSGLDSISITIGKAEISYQRAFVKLVLDSANWTATDSGIDVTANVSGDYPELMPGENVVKISSNTGGEIMIDYRANYLYGLEVM